MRESFLCRLSSVIFILYASVKSTVALDVGVSYVVYATPERPYVEVNLEIAASSVTFKAVDSFHLSASVEVLLLVRRGETIVNYEKYLLNSPPVTAPRDLLDVKRFFVDPGEYTLEVALQDVEDAHNRRILVYPLRVEVGHKPYLTDILLLRNYRRDTSENPFVKHGFFLEPLPFAFYEQRATRLVFFAEIYHGEQLGPNGYMVRYYVEQEMGNGVTSWVAGGTQRKKPSRIDAILAALDIRKLKSGNYTLTVDCARKTTNLSLSAKSPFNAATHS